MRTLAWLWGIPALVLCTLVSSQAAAQLGPFSAGAPLPVANAQGLAVTGADGNIYLFGGYAGGAESNVAYRFNVANNTYTTLVTMPVASRGPCGDRLPDGRIAVVGGYGGTSLNTLQIFNPVTNTWTQGPAQPQANGWECAAVTGGDGNLHVFGGEAATLQYAIYNPTTNSWTLGPDMPNPRLSAGAAFASNRFYVFGGFDSLTTVDIFNPVTNTWTSGPAMPGDGAGQFGWVTVGSQIYVLGGSTTYGNNALPFFNSVWILDTALNSWTVSAITLALGVRESAAAYASDVIHVFGGSTGTVVSDHQIAVAASDNDGDGVPDATDNCPDHANMDQEDADDDGAGDACDICPFDPDDDLDGDQVCGDEDNCPDVSNPNQSDTDMDGEGDACESEEPCEDGDGDGLCSDVDNCPTRPNELQTDSDGDGRGDECDLCPDDPDDDIDGDGLCADRDPCPTDADNRCEDDSSSGCGCRTAGRAQHGNLALLLMAAALMARRRRRARW